MKRKRITWGIICILLAVLIVLIVTGVLSIPMFAGISVLKAVFTIIFGLAFIASVISLEFDPSLLFLAILIKMYDKALFGQSIPVAIMIVIVLLLIIGYHLLVPRRHHKMPNPPQNNNGKGTMNVSEENGEYIFLKNHFCGTTKYINSKNFKEANVDNAFGACEMYFNNTFVPSGECTLNLNARFSGVEIYLPRNWKVNNNMKFSMGGVNEEPIRLMDGEFPPVEFNLNGTSEFSGIEIKRV